MNGDTSITEADLHAYVDGQLPVERRRQIEAYLAERPDELRRVDAYRAQRHELRALFDPVLDEAVPPHLMQTARHAPRRSLPWWPWSWRSLSWRPLPWRPLPLRRVAAAIALLLVGGIVGWGLHDVLPAGGAGSSAGMARAPAASDPAGAFARRAAVAHAVFSPERRRPVEVDAAHEDQLVTWLSRRLGAPIRVPALQGLGYALEGGRLLPGGAGPVAQLMYRDEAGNRMTLYVSNEAGDLGSAAREADTRGSDGARTGFRFAQQGPVNVFYWIDGSFGYAISAEIDRSALAAISAEVYRQLAARP